jgi:hypothetical protein
MYYELRALYAEIEASLQAHMIGSEHTCARPSAPRVLKEVLIQTFKGLVSLNVNTADSLEKSTKSKRVWAGSTQLNYGIITLTFYSALKSEWDMCQ